MRCDKNLCQSATEVAAKLKDDAGNELLGAVREYEIHCHLSQSRVAERAECHEKLAREYSNKLKIAVEGTKFIRLPVTRAQRSWWKWWEKEK